MGKAARTYAKKLLQASRTQGLDRIAYREDPDRYAREVLKFYFWAKQKEIAESVRDNPITVVDSGHGVGKTSSAGSIVNWFFDIYDPVLVLTTAPSWNSVRTLLWKEIRRQRVNKGLPGILNETSLKHGETRLALGLSTDDETKFQGHHEANMLVVADEGPGIRQEIYNAIEGNRVGQNNRLLSLGNPISRNTAHDKLKEKIRMHQQGRGFIRLSCLEHPNVVERSEIIPGAVTWQWVDEHVREWCERTDEPPAPDNAHFYWEGLIWKPSAIAMSKILGIVPPSSEDAVVPYEMIAAAQKRRAELRRKVDGLVQVGIDVAYTGADENVLYARYGEYVDDAVVWSGLDTIAGANRIWQELQRIKNAYPGIKRVKVLLDQGGAVGVYDNLKRILREEKVRWVEALNVNFGGGAVDAENYSNMRAELYMHLRKALKTAGIDPSDAKLARELESHHFKLDSKRRIQIESKEAIKSRLGRSPDRSDALVLALYDGNLHEGDWIPSYRTVLQGLIGVYRDR